MRRCQLLLQGPVLVNDSTGTKQSPSTFSPGLFRYLMSIVCITLMKSSSSPPWTRQRTRRPWTIHTERSVNEYLTAASPFPVSFIDLEAHGERCCGVEHRISEDLELSPSSLVTFLQLLVQDPTARVQIPSFVIHGPWQSKSKGPGLPWWSGG